MAFLIAPDWKIMLPM